MNSVRKVEVNFTVYEDVVLFWREIIVVTHYKWVNDECNGYDAGYLKR